MHSSVPMLRLATRGGDGLCCDARGVGLGPVTLVEAADASGRRVYRVRPDEEVARALSLAYDPLTSAYLARRLSGLAVAARALEAGDMAKAMVATVLLKLPPLSAAALPKLARDPALRKYSADQPRDERGRWSRDGEVRVASNDSGTATDAGGASSAKDRVALNILERQFVTEDMERKAKSVLRNITDNALTDAEIDNVFDQVIHNISRTDAEKFGSINPSSKTIALSPEQLRIVNDQIQKLTPDLRTKAQAAFKKAQDSGRVTCPTR
jgi:hypothetical protein